ncbi:hypothetical protein [Neorhizobium alkalisoli]|uniref:Uncharacterized protein n=1 Tax=Neorhizobium alkalisoli TaxID=528178 RepID=A0A561PUP2_9HYPH|nr:hypothetical protein [Neorhizobium alkalisoli]TWF41829.1 hypothetical protein FHW37_12512 [Neorhizobium alkalisoli]
MFYEFYVLQYRPGSDDILFFSETFEECLNAAKEHLSALREGTESETPNIPAIPIFKCKLRQPDGASVLTLLNSVDDCGKAVFIELVTERELIALVSE